MGKGGKNKLSYSILISGILVACFGLVAIYDASVIDAFKTFGDKFHYVKQQSVWLIIGIIASLITAKIPLGLIKKFTPHILAGSLLLWSWS